MKRNSLNLFMLLFIGCCVTSLFYSCSKDEAFQSNMLETDIVKFKTLKEYHDALNDVLSMSKEERKNYEESQGYISFGRQCDEFYSEIDFDKFESIEEIKAFAASSGLIKVIQDEDGEFIFETMLSSKFDRYLINSDRLFQIGDFVYKVFEDGTASTHIDNLHKLVQNKSFSVNSIPEDAEIAVSHIDNKSSNLKDAAYNCDNYQYIAESAGNYRAGLELNVTLYHDYSILFGDPITTLYVGYTLKAFRKKTFGWAYSERRLKYIAKVAVDLSPTLREFYKDSNTRDVDGTYTHVFVNRWIGDGIQHYPYDVHFGAYYGHIEMINHPDVTDTRSENLHLFPTGF